MAHFAELNSSGTVIQVIVVSNADVDAHGGDESAGAEAFVETIVPFNTGGVAWKQTSYNSNFRKQYASIGGSYSSSKDMFLTVQPYSSWTNDSNGDWKAPVTDPNVSEIGGLTVFESWDESNLRWLGSTYSGNEFNTGTEVEYRWDASALEWVAL
tara:strand:+ start:83 stop:547 length:465 start_codon:yes stop_codon:yes gene_type:complete